MEKEKKEDQTNNNMDSTTKEDGTSSEYRKMKKI